MSLDFVIGFIVGMGLYTGIRTIQLSNKTRGIIQLILTILSPVLVYLWCSKKSSFVFGGTDLEFLIQTMTVDKMIEPWIILILYICLIVLIIYNIIQINKIRNNVNK